MATFIEGLAADCAEALFERYLEALDDGFASSSILALVEPPTVARWSGRLADRVRQEDRIMTPFSWVKRELELWWPLVDPALPPIAAGSAEPVAREPLIVQIDMAQYLMERFTAPYREETGAFCSARTPEALRYIHLLDSLARGIENILPPAEIGERLLASAARPEDRLALAHVQPCLDRYRQEMLAHRILDQALAWELFCEVLLGQLAYRSHLGTTRALLVEAADEATPLAAASYEAVAGGCERVYLGWRRDGAQRSYLGADPVGTRARWPEADVISVGPGSPTQVELGEALLAGLATLAIPWERRHPAVPPKADETALVQVEKTGYLDMLTALADDLAETLRTVSSADVALVAPALDPLLLFWLRGRLGALGHELVILAGSNRLVDHSPAAALLALGTLGVGGSPADRLARHEWLGLLEQVTPADPFALDPVAAHLAHADVMVDPADVAKLAPDADTSGYERLHDWVLQAHAKPADSLEALFRSAFARVLGPCLVSRSRESLCLRRPPQLIDPDPALHLAEAGRTLGLTEGGLRQLGQMAQLVEASGRFDAIASRLGDDDGLPGRLARFRRFLWSGAIAERPFSDFGLAMAEGRQHAILLATASQFAQQGDRVAIQFWLDTSSPRWWKSDARELTNARVLRRDRPAGSYNAEEDRQDMDAKLGRVLLACCARARRQIRAYASVLDSVGREQPGGLADRLVELAEAART